MTIKSKTQLEKTNQELLVEKEALLLELEELKGQNAELRLQLARVHSQPEGKSRAASHVDEEKKSRTTSKNFETIGPKTSGELSTKGGASQKHSFSVATFSAPTKSSVSGRLLFGSVRQGLRCDSK